jgi:hypothetical protein
MSLRVHTCIPEECCSSDYAKCPRYSEWNELYNESLKKEYPKLNLGCFISKPFDMNNLVNRIKKELASGGN